MDNKDTIQPLGNAFFDEKRAQELKIKITAALKNYRCQYHQDEFGDCMDLVDILSPLDTVKEGKLEIELLADHIICAIMDGEE